MICSFSTEKANLGSTAIASGILRILEINKLTPLFFGVKIPNGGELAW